MSAAKSKVQLSRSEEILRDLTELSRRCLLSAPDLVWMSSEIASDEKAGLYYWPSKPAKGRKKGGDGSQTN